MTSLGTLTAVAPTAEDPALGTVGTLRAAVLVLSRRLRHQVDSPGTDSPDQADEVSATEVATLARIRRCAPITPSDLARAEHVRPPSMTAILERLAQLGLVRREPHPHDGRRVLVSLTPEGETFLERTRAVRTRWLAGQFDQLDAADQAALTAAAGALARLAELP